ncbi:MAG: PEP-CTERM sorting domain-containing protein [Planctomycetota bacterium]
MQQNKLNTARLGTYAASAAALSIAAPASAGIVFTEVGPVDGALFNGPNVAGQGTSNGGNDIIIPIDFDQDGTAEMEVVYEEPVTNNLNIKIQGSPTNAVGNAEDEIVVDRTQAAGNANSPLNLQFGDTIDASLTSPERSFQFIGLTDSGNSPSGISNSNGGGNFDLLDPIAPEYIGVRTIIDGEQHYGWIGIVITERDNTNDVLTGFVSGYAYNDVPGAGIKAGAIPEPTSAAVLALGAAGLASMRRRR